MERPWLKTEQWPPGLLPLLRRYGSEEVWDVGLEALGYPAMWCDRISEFRAVKAALERKHGSD